MTGPKTIEQLHEMASRPAAGVVDALSRVEGDFVVLGAGGKMGFHLTAMLQRGLDASGSSARVLAVSRFRSDTARQLFEGIGIETIQTDLLEAPALDALPDARNVIFLAGVKFGTTDNPQLLHATNVELPARVAERYAESRLVALSTGCVYPFVSTDSGGSSESDPPDPSGDYAESCLQRELAIINSSCTPAAIIRLNYSVDLRYGVLVDIAQRVFSRQPVDLKTDALNFIWQGDANAFILQSFSKVSRPPFILNVTGKRSWRVHEIANYFGQAFGVPVTFSGNPAATAWLSDASLCHRIFGQPTVGDTQLIGWVADWLESGGETLDRPTHFETRDGSF